MTPQLLYKQNSAGEQMDGSFEKLAEAVSNGHDISLYIEGELFSETILFNCCYLTPGIIFFSSPFHLGQGHHIRKVINDEPLTIGYIYDTSATSIICRNKFIDENFVLANKNIQLADYKTYSWFLARQFCHCSDGFKPGIADKKIRININRENCLITRPEIIYHAPDNLASFELKSPRLLCPDCFTRIIMGDNGLLKNKAVYLMMFHLHFEEYIVFFLSDKYFLKPNNSSAIPSSLHVFKKVLKTSYSLFKPQQ